MKFSLLIWIGSVALCGSGLTANAALYSFAGSNTGAIPDSTSTGPGQYTSSRVVSFNVAGLSSGPATMSLSLTMTHTYVGDLDVVLRSPNGTAFTIFSRVGAANAGSLGDSSNLNGLYTFTDTATGNFWAASAAVNNNRTIAAGSYRTSAAGPGAGGTTSFDAAFSSLTAAEANGTWTLTFRDGANVDTGTVSGATLQISTVPEVHPGLIGTSGCLLLCLGKMRRKLRVKA